MAVSDISITITQNSQSIANNASNITVTGKCKTTGPSMDYNTRTGTVTIDGKDYSFTSKFPETSTITIFTKTVNVTHDTDGKKTVSASFKVTTGMTGTLPGGVISASTSKTLTTIPRNSKVSLSSTNFNIGTKITINTNRASSSFTHTAVITYNGKTIRTQTGIGASYSWDTSELYKYIPNGNSATGKVTLTTYSGSTKIGSSTEVTFTAKVVNSNPNFSNFEYYDNNSKTIALTGNNQVFIKKYSNAIIKIPVAYKMVTKNSATPSKYIAVAGSASNEKAYSDTADVEIPINNINSTTINVYAVDSRNNQTNVSKALSTIDFKECVLQSLNIDRENGVGTYIEITILGTYNNINFGAVSNTIETAILRCKAVGTTTWEEFDIKQLLTIENGKISCSNVRFTQKEFILGTEYDIEIKITDKLSSDSETASVNSGKVLMSAVKEYGVCFGGLYDKSVGGVLQSKGQIYMRENKILGFDVNNGFVDYDGNIYRENRSAITIRRNPGNEEFIINQAWNPFSLKLETEKMKIKNNFSLSNGAILVNKDCDAVISGQIMFRGTANAYKTANIKIDRNGTFIIESEGYGRETSDLFTVVSFTNIIENLKAGDKIEMYIGLGAQGSITVAGSQYTYMTVQEI